MTRWAMLSWIAGLLTLAWVVPAYAHPAAFGVARWRVDEEQGELLLRLPPASLRNAELRPVFPDGCSGAELQRLADNDAVALRWRVQCTTGTDGVVGFDALPDTLEIHLDLADGRSTRLRSDTPSTDISAAESGGYFRVGIFHILGGWDHLLFVLGLFLLVGGLGRRLLGVVTTFTLAHSLTLAASLVGPLRVDTFMVEVLIAASIVLVGREALSDRPTLTRTHPFTIAGLFGLVHGLGFAGALQEVGLPPNDRVVALLTFNLGVEVGQVLFLVAVALAAGFKEDKRARFNHVLAYAVGVGGAFALFLRLT